MSIELMSDKPIIRQITQNEHAVAIMMRFKRSAREQNCDLSEVEAVLDKCKQGNYEQLVETIEANSLMCNKED